MLAKNAIKVARFSKHIFPKKSLYRDNTLGLLNCRCNFASSVCRAKWSQYTTFKTQPSYSNSIQNKSENNDTNSNESPKHQQSEELLEKIFANMSGDLYRRNRVYKNDVVRALAKIKEMNLSTKKQGLFLIRACTDLMPDETAMSKFELAKQIWQVLEKHSKLDVDYYNALLEVYRDTKKTINVSAFIQKMAPTQPTMKTYELFLEVLAQAGDVNQATEVISNMKVLGMPATEQIFNSLILCQGKAGNLKNIQEIMIMMKSLKIKPSMDTHTCILCAFAMNRQKEAYAEELRKVKQLGMRFEERHVMEIVKVLADAGLNLAVPEILTHLPPETLKSPSISPYMQSVTTQLVFQNHPMVALDVYNCLPLPSFGPSDDTGLHGRSLIRDCVKASVPTGVIVLMAQNLMGSGRNQIALQCACEAALQLGKVPMAIDLMTRMKYLGMAVRPHYFWPIFLNQSKGYGESGMMNTLQSMAKLEVMPDYETLLNYVLPYVSFTSPQNLMKKFIDCGLTATVVLTPVMHTLLNTGQVRAASELAEIFKGKIDAEKLLDPLLKGYLMSLDIKSTIYILEDILKRPLQSDRDWTGRFLCCFVQHKKLTHDVSDFVALIKALATAGLRISPAAADFCITNLPNKHSEDVKNEIKFALTTLTDEKMVDEGEIFSQQLIHPKYMNQQDLSAHLSELEAKGMNTRGVLRKLLQKYCSSGELNEARKIIEKCEKEGILLSAGMKASIFDVHVKFGELDMAENILADLNKTAPNFTLDEFKIIDFATKLAISKKAGKAMEIITEQSKRKRITGGKGIEQNCWRLLDAVANHGTAQETKDMFDLITKLGYCQPTNTMLGPLVRVHIKAGNIARAVEEFVSISQKYKKTPLKHVLLCEVLKQMSDGQTEENFITNEKTNSKLNQYAQAILNADKLVHGHTDVQLTLIAALADVGYTKTLRKMFLDPSVRFHPEALMRRCERFADEKKTHALLNIAECARDRRIVDIKEIYSKILSVYQRADDCKSALNIWIKMQENDVIPSKQFVKNLCGLLKANNKEVPKDLVALLSDNEKREIQLN